MPQETTSQNNEQSKTVNAIPLKQLKSGLNDGLNERAITINTII